MINDKKLENAMEDLEYFKRKLTKAIGTPREVIARERCEILESAIENYKKIHRPQRNKKTIGIQQNRKK